MDDISRRKFLKYGICAVATAAIPFPRLALAAMPTKELAFYNLHTGENLSIAFCEQGRYVPSAMTAINELLRDFRTGDVHSIDPALLEQLHSLQHMVQTPGPFHVISGYRSPKTNETLHALSKGVANSSMHIQGRAIDIRLPGKDLVHLHNAALSMQAGGVGFYPESDFIHIDTGRVRRWGQSNSAV
jgi:uncharacterized protein YcbK (DUF882 family)